MVQPTALNLLIIGLMVIIFNFFWRTTAAWLVDRNPDSELGKAMATLNS